MFLVNSCLGLFSAAHSREHPLFRSYGVNLPSSLTTLLPLALESSSYLPVSVCGTGIADIHRAFLASIQVHLPYSNFGPLQPGLPTPGMYPSTVSLCLNLLMATESPPYVHRRRLSASPSLPATLERTNLPPETLGFRPL